MDSNFVSVLYFPFSCKFFLSGFLKLEEEKSKTIMIIMCVLMEPCDERKILLTVVFNIQFNYLLLCFDFRCLDLLNIQILAITSTLHV